MKIVKTENGNEIEVTPAQFETILDKTEIDPNFKIIGPEIGGYGTIMCRFCGMILGIEKDGYAHT